MELGDLITHLRAFYIEVMGQPPYEITLGRFWYERAREMGIVEMPPSWQTGNGHILRMRISLDLRDDYKIAIEDYRRYQYPDRHNTQVFK